MQKQDIIEAIAFNIIQGRVEAEDDGFDEGLEGKPAVSELVQELAVFSDTIRAFDGSSVEADTLVPSIYRIVIRH